jgi:hypothetical protein
MALASSGWPHASNYPESLENFSQAGEAQAGEVYLFSDENVTNILLLNADGTICFVRRLNVSLIDDDHCHILSRKLLPLLADDSAIPAQMEFYGAAIHEQFLQRLRIRKNSLRLGNTDPAQRLVVFQDRRQDNVSVTLDWNTGQFLACANTTMTNASNAVHKIKLPSPIYRKLVSRLGVNPDSCVIYDWKEKAFKVVEWSVAIAAVVAAVYGGYYAYQTTDQWIPIAQQYYEIAKGRASTLFEGAKHYGETAWEGVKHLSGRISDGAKYYGANAWEGVKHLSGRTSDGAKYYGTSAWEGVKHLSERISDGAKYYGANAFEGAKHYGANAFEGAKHYGANAWEGVKYLSGQAWEQAKTAGRVASTVLPIATVAKTVGSWGRWRNDDAQGVPQELPSAQANLPVGERMLPESTAVATIPNAQYIPNAQ